jgi:hypothetical protein
LAPFSDETNAAIQFAKTGSGQTQEKAEKIWRVSPQAGRPFEKDALVTAVQQVAHAVRKNATLCAIYI